MGRERESMRVPGGGRGEKEEEGGKTKERKK